MCYDKSVHSFIFYKHVDIVSELRFNQKAELEFEICRAKEMRELESDFDIEVKRIKNNQD